MSFRYLLVDEFWTHVGSFESEPCDWSVGQDFVDSGGRRFAIVAITMNPDPAAEFTAT